MSSNTEFSGNFVSAEFCVEMTNNSNTVWIVHLLQKCVIRIIYNIGYRDSTGDLFKDAKIMNVYDLNIFYVCMFMFKYQNGSLPTVLQNMFTLRQDIHIHETRNRSMYKLIHCRTEIRKKSFVYIGASYYNQLMQNPSFQMSDSHSIFMFRHRLKLAIESQVITVT